MITKIFQQLFIFHANHIRNINFLNMLPSA